MSQPNWEIVARAVCNMEGITQGLKNKTLEKYIEANHAARIPTLQASYAQWLARQTQS